MDLENELLTARAEREAERLSEFSAWLLFDLLCSFDIIWSENVTLNEAVTAAKELASKSKDVAQEPAPKKTRKKKAPPPSNPACTPSPSTLQTMVKDFETRMYFSLRYLDRAF